tara:strand:- start:2076 stop:3170 length:1095 start_codon:yes stop_codon:yes gene_type:complete
MAFSGYGGLEKREQEKDKAKAAIAKQLAANEEWDRRNKLQFEDSLNLKLADLAIKNGGMFSNGMVSRNGKDSETGMTNSEARNTLMKNFKVVDDDGKLVDDDKFLAALSRIDATEDPQGFIKLYSALTPYITAMKKDSMGETFIGDEVRREVIDIVSKSSRTGPDADAPQKVLNNIKSALGNSRLDERIKQMIELTTPTGGSFNITEEPIYVNKPKVEDITEFEKFVVKPVISRAESDKSRMLKLMGSIGKKKDKGPYDDQLELWYTNRVKDIDIALEAVEKDKNYGQIASLYTSSFFEKALDQYGNMNRVKDLIDPNIVGSAKTPIYVPNVEIAKILQNNGILKANDIVFLQDIEQLRRMPEQ